MVNAYIIHGRNSNPNKAWIPWLKDKLVLEGLEVFTPAMPNAYFPSPNRWNDTLEAIVKTDEKSIFIGHSLGCQAILRYVASKNIQIEGIFLVSAFQKVNTEQVYEKTKEKLPKYLIGIRELVAKYSVMNSDKWCDKELPWESVRRYDNKINLFFSTDDYYVDKEQQELFRQKLPNSNIKIIKDGGHLGDAKGLVEFPELLDSIKKAYK